jgi:guanine deaminase
MVMDPSELMWLAIEKSRAGIAAGQSPFGCAIARDGELLSCSHNTVVFTTDITAHAEVNAIREACRAVGDIFLTGAVAATTCEPCPMCMAALHWARVDTVYYGATIADANEAGFNELQLPAAELLRLGGSTLKLVPQILPAECKQLFADWLVNPNRKVY